MSGRVFVGCLLAVSLASPSLHAEAPAAPLTPRQEAAQRFDRGLKLFDAQDNAGALAEFQRADELSPHVLLAYNIGLVYAAMNRPVQSAAALERALATPDALKPAQVARARAVLSEQTQRIGRVRVTTRPEGAQLEVDGMTAGKTPLAAPLKVASGTHVVGAVLEEHAPVRREVTVAGNQEIALELELVPTEGGRLAHLGLKCNVVDAVVTVDGQRVARTPLVASLALASGRHEVELSRPGYASVRKEIDIGPGATGELAFDLEVDLIALGQSGSTLSLELSEPGAVVSIDGKVLGPYRGALKLPEGAHSLKVERDGFFPAERQVSLEPGVATSHVIRLEPTPETRAEHESSVSFHRTWGLASLIAGGVVAGAGGTFLALNASEKSDAQKALDLTYDRQRNEVICDVASGDDPDVCNARYQLAKKNYDDKKGRDVFGFVGLGVGGALVVTGVVLLLTGEAADKYERTAKVDVHLGPGAFGARLRTSF